MYIVVYIHTKTYSWLKKLKSITIKITINCFHLNYISITLKIINLIILHHWGFILGKEN